ncbi:hypothetical protein D3C72_1283410 [compost metagenome]
MPAKKPTKIFQAACKALLRLRSANPHASNASPPITNPASTIPIQPWRWNNCVPSNEPKAPPMK